MIFIPDVGTWSQVLDSADSSSGQGSAHSVSSEPIVDVVARLRETVAEITGKPLERPPMRFV